MHESFGVEKGLLTTIHAYTNDQVILDTVHKDLRRARAAGLNIIPTTTGAARAVTVVMPELKGRMDGMAFRVPTATVSVCDFVATLSRPTTVEEINNALRDAATNSLRGILAYSDEPLVSSDFRGNSASSIVDAASTMVMDGSLVKTVSWYDNEWGYACRLADLCAFLVDKGL
jgi:glyceraldehyde 3-phosphate dehydrogenase